MKHLLYFLLLFFSLAASAQQSDSQLAFTYYQNKEYLKAAEIFMQLYERSKASHYLNFHIICLINAKEYDKAESVLKKFLKADENNKDFLINLGYIYSQQGKVNKAEDYFNRAIKKLVPHTNDIRNLANKFREIREYGWANKTYLKGRELLRQPNAFVLDMGDNCMMDRDYDNMCSLFTEALKNDPGQLNSVTSKLRFARSYDVNGNADRSIGSCLEKIFGEKDYAPVFDELGVWYALQMQDYTSAFGHAVKLNSRLPDKLYIYTSIAQDAADARKYAVAEKAYRQILQRGKENNPYYATAAREILRCSYKKYEETATPAETYRILANGCTNFLQENGYTTQNAEIALILSDIYLYRLNRSDSADAILQKSIQARGLNAPTLNLFKSKRADLLTFTGNPWEAVILYTQIEKANPNNDLGYEAKLKKARLAYFEGDILWAKAQYDVLKGSTSKLISNDALKMSHFINMNYEEEGDNTALECLAATEYKIHRRQYAEALPVLDSLISSTPAGIADYASLAKARLLLAEFKNTEAMQLLEKLGKDSEQTYVRAEALYELANLKARTGFTGEALGLYKRLVSEYSGSVYSVEAGKCYRDLEKNPGV